MNNYEEKDWEDDSPYGETTNWNQGRITTRTTTASFFRIKVICWGGRDFYSFRMFIGRQQTFKISIYFPPFIALFIQCIQIFCNENHTSVPVLMCLQLLFTYKLKLRFKYRP